QLPCSLSFGKILFFIARRELARVWQNPNLQQVHRLALRGIELAVRDTSARGHALHVAGSNYRTVAHAVAMFERAFENVRDDFHVTVRVHGKSLAGGDAVFVDNAQAAEMHLSGIVIL